MEWTTHQHVNITNDILYSKGGRHLVMMLGIRLLYISSPSIPIFPLLWIPKSIPMIQADFASPRQGTDVEIGNLGKTPHHSTLSTFSKVQKMTNDKGVMARDRDEPVDTIWRRIVSENIGMTFLTDAGFL